ncbi:chemotaxis protein CheR [Marinobacterium nitratireducens]|uniref:Chemotaxis protein methyltransferase n=1 Tax=Marinobacterium nitratireducens TaxID=518897 RepID=A0A918DUR0_9GAMM|nr:protein-glutamate O-methyltransferase CheR [Marinobacterium nitratireducens]GGO84891.1 chemotaxis protein CheR [Marinobacterium nitratireducens]
MIQGTGLSFNIKSDDFRQFCQFLESSCGILLAEHKQYLVQSRLGTIMREQRVACLSDLLKLLKSPSGLRLREQVIDAMTTNETLWFRDVHPFEILSGRVLPELRGEIGYRRLRIWSAACSTGQEPYSISMLLDEYRQANPGAFGAGEEILATDISSRVLEQARSGRYEMLAIGRGLAQDRLQRHFMRETDGSWTLKPGIRSRVRFQSLNLLGPYGSLGQFDIIFCRNVLIYFSTELKLDILRRMRAQLRPGGYLFLGASESLSGLSDCYRMIHCRPGIIYQAV